MRSIVCPEREIELRENDIIFMYTDGLVEARVGSDLFGEERVVKILERHRSESAHHLVDAVNKACLDFCHGDLADDVTVLALRVKG